MDIGQTAARRHITRRARRMWTTTIFRCACVCVCVSCAYFTCLWWCLLELTLFRALFPPAPLLTWTLLAPSKRSFSWSPITRNGGSRIQHVFTVHEPDIP